MKLLIFCYSFVCLDAAGFGVCKESSTRWLLNDTEAPVSIMHLAFCTPNKKVGIMNCVLPSRVGLVSAVFLWDGLACAFLADAGGLRVL